ncbi:MAG: hypothetical protein HC922_04225 [Leptolyngbyaceae cyanobacterium SM2_3_12]|nr:hypothetical protein [Leptolyngbyaceae cyanobacterium SM2_3_12]
MGTAHQHSPNTNAPNPLPVRHPGYGQPYPQAFHTVGWASPTQAMPPDLIPRKAFDL